MRRLAAGEGGDPQVVAGESAVAGLAGAIAARADAGINAALGLDEHSRILVIGTEGATDPDLYRQLVGEGSEIGAI
jgi:diaminopropionate ammonia-lyase